jgi:hypothetical protein
MYFAPGTSGSITAWRLTVLQEMTASSTTATPAAMAGFRLHRPGGSRRLMKGSFVMGKALG